MKKRVLNVIIGGFINVSVQVYTSKRKTEIEARN